MSTTTSSTNPVGSILTIDQAAAYLAIPKATLYTWRTRRTGYGPPAVKFGSCLRYRRSDLDAWIADHLECFDNDSPGVTVHHDTSATPTGDSAIDSSHSSRGRGQAR